MGQLKIVFTIAPAKQTQTITASDVTATYGDTGVKINASTNGDGALSYAVKSGDAVTVDASGNLTINKAGSAVITVTAAETDTYAKATKDVTVTVNTKAMTVSAEDVNATVDGQPHGITVTVTDPASGATVKYGTEAGSYTLDVSPTQTEVGEKTVYYQVTADNYTTYTGSAKVTVSAKQTQTITASDVTATYGDTGVKINASTTGDGGLSYAIKSGDAVTVDASGNLTIVKAGSAIITVTAAETDTYAQATKDVNVTVNTKAMTVSAEDVNATIDGQPHGITVNVTDPATGSTVKYGTEAGTYNLDASPTQTEVGEKTVYYQVKADNYTTYTGSAKVTVSAKQTQTITASDVTATYGDTDKKVSATTNGDGAISYAVKEGSADYIDVNASTGALTIKKVGTATVIVTAAETATYTQATKEVTVTINKANAVAATVTANNRTYDGTEKPLVTVTGTPTGGEMQYALGTATEATEQYTTSIPTATNAGTYYVWYKAVGDENHNDSEAACVTATVGKRSITLTSATAGKPYDGTPLADGSVAVSGDGFAEGEGASYDVTGAQTDVGGSANSFTYTLDEGTKADNYSITKTEGTLTVTPINATVTITGHHASATYDGAEHSVSGYDASADTALYDVGKDFTFSGAAEARRTEEGTTSMGLAAGQFANTNANFATVTFNVTDGYQTIVPVGEVVVTIVGNSSTATYDGTEHAVSGYVATASDELYDVEADFSFDGTAEASRTDVGKAAMGLSADQFANANPNFDKVTFDVTDGWQAVEPRAVTVTANVKSKTYGQDDPELTSTVAGLVEGESESLITRALSRAKGEDVGEYAITAVGDAVQGNYAVTYVSGKLTVTKATLAVTADAKTKVYGEKDPQLTYGYSGLAMWDDASVITGTLARAEGEAAGSYDIVRGTLDAGRNYEVSFTGAKLTITAAGSGSVETDVVTDEGAPRASASNMGAVADAVLTAEEKAAVKDGAAARVWLESSALAEGNVPAADRSGLAAAASSLGATPGTWLDLSLWKQVTGFGKVAVHETDTPVRFSVEVPEGLRREGRTFYLLGFHGGKATTVAQGTGTTLSGESRLFSTYLIAYKDAQAKSTSNTSTTTKGTSTAKASSLPRTGDPTSLSAIAAYALGGAASVASGAALRTRVRRRRGRHFSK
ncbi:MAG: hypothetical protein IKG11_08575 [Atopobiaceae bacterium]|nr:hypothetical protein [Atopobiaceae bacterium]